jgi:hypothetical protein
MLWTARLLLSPPLSGSVPEHHFDNGCHGAPWVWALFEEHGDGETAWTGSFRAGDLVPYRAVHVVATADDAVVVAGGYAYWVSLQDRTVRYTHDFVSYSVEVPGRPLVVGATYTEVFVLSPGGVLWCSDRIALDGITISAVTSHQVTGEAAGYPDPVPFVLDLDTMQLQGGVEVQKRRR